MRAMGIALFGLGACGGGATFADAPPAIDAPVDAPVDASDLDGPDLDAPDLDASDGGDGPPPQIYNCGAFSQAPTWTVTPGFRAVVVADAADGINQPVAIAIPGGAFGANLYVVNQGDDQLMSVDPDDGATTVFAATAAWPVTPALLTAIVHDSAGVFDGNLYVGDQGSDADGDSRIYRVTPAGTPTVHAAPPGPGLDDVFGMAFSPGGAYPAGLLVTGDTDNAALPDWGVLDAAGAGTAFSEAAGAEGVAVDLAGTYGGGVFAARPAGGGYAGDDSIGRIAPDGTAEPRLVTALPGVHGLAFAPPGPFGGLLHGASWASGRLFSVSTTGVVSDLATGLALTNYGANMLAFSPDGRVLYVADRAANRVVCIEPVPPN